jgi:hypothetical protein
VLVDLDRAAGGVEPDRLQAELPQVEPASGRHQQALGLDGRAVVQLDDPGLADKPAVASGALRTLQALLADLDPNRTFGGLEVVPTATNDLLWACPIQYTIYVPQRPVLQPGEPARRPG